MVKSLSTKPTKRTRTRTAAHIEPKDAATKMPQQHVDELDRLIASMPPEFRDLALRILTRPANTGSSTGTDANSSK